MTTDKLMPAAASDPNTNAKDNADAGAWQTIQQKGSLTEAAYESQIRNYPPAFFHVDVCRLSLLRPLRSFFPSEAAWPTRRAASHYVILLLCRPGSFFVHNNGCFRSDERRHFQAFLTGHIASDLPFAEFSLLITDNLVMCKSQQTPPPPPSPPKPFIISVSLCTTRSTHTVRP